MLNMYELQIEKFKLHMRIMIIVFFLASDGFCIPIFIFHFHRDAQMTQYFPRQILN